MGPRVDVEIVRFAGTREASIVELVLVLGIERAEALAIVDRGGGTIKRSIPRSVAESYRDGLARAGVVVELRDVLVPPRRSERPKSPTARPPETGMTDVVRGGPVSVPAGARSSAIASDRPAAPVAIPRAAPVPEFEIPRDRPDEPRRAPAGRAPADAAVEIDLDFAHEAVPPPRAAPSQRAPVSPRSPIGPELAPFHVVSHRPPPPDAHGDAPAPKGARALQPTFWASVVPALGFPVRGVGIKWLAWIAVYTIFLDLVVTCASWLGPLGIALFVVYGSGLVTLTTGYFRACMRARAVDAPRPNDLPELDASAIGSELLLPGLSTAAFVVLSQAALWVWIAVELSQGVSLDSLRTSEVTWALALVPTAYWPMGIGRVALTGRPSSIWDVPGALRAIFTSPVQYAALVLIGVAAYVVPWLAFYLFVAPVGPVAILVGAPFLFGLPFAYSHGVQGTLMAHVLAKATPAHWE